MNGDNDAMNLLDMLIQLRSTRYPPTNSINIRTKRTKIPKVTHIHDIE